MTNDLIRRRFDAFDRIKGFGTKFGSEFAANSRGAQQFAEITTVTDAMRTAGADKLSGSGAYHGGTSSKRFWAGELKEDLDEIRNTAVAISEAEGTPEFDDQFRSPRSQSYEALLSTARAFLKDAAPHKALFIEFEMAADFLDDLASDIEEFEKADDAQDTGLGDQVGGTGSLAELSARGMKARKLLLAIVPNKFKGNTAALAEWETARHIERAPKAAKKAAAAPAA